MTIFQFLVGVRWIHFASAFVLFGSSFFWFYMRPGLLWAGPRRWPKALGSTVILLRVAAPAAAVSGVAWLAGMLVNMTSDVGSLLDPEILRLFFFETPFGAPALIRLALLAFGVAIAAAPCRGGLWFAALMGIGALLLISQAWLGHAAEGGAGLYGYAMILVYGVHILAAGAWVGGLPPLLFALAELRSFDTEEARRLSLEILSRYSVMAMAAVTLIVASGIANAGFRVAGSFDKLFYTSYGDALIAKAAAVAAMLALACFNRFAAMPRLRAAALTGQRQILTLRRSVACELALGVFVLGAAAVLGITMPPQ
jgi:putative copper resistance protein D